MEWRLRPNVSSIDDDNKVANVYGMIIANKFITLKELQEVTGFVRGTLQVILHDDLEMTMVFYTVGASCTHTTTESETPQNLQRTSSLHDAHSVEIFVRLVPEEALSVFKNAELLVTFFWDVQGSLLMDWLEHGRAINSNRHYEITRTRGPRSQQPLSGQMGKAVLLYNEIAHPHQPEHTQHSRGVGFHYVSKLCVLTRPGTLRTTLFLTR